MSRSIDSVKPITTLRGYTYPQYMIFFDTESYIDIDSEENEDTNEFHTLRLGVAIYIHIDKQINVLEKEIYHYKTSDEFWNYVERKTIRKNTLYIYAHNAKYDTLNVDIIEQLEKRKFDVPYPTINNAFIISATKNRKKLKIVDTFNYARTSVESIGKKLDVPKISLDEYRLKATKKIRYTQDNKYTLGEIDFNSIPDSVLLPYCENDVEIIAQFILSLIRLLNTEYKGKKLGSLKYTTAGIALDIYRHSFVTKPIYYHQNDTLLKLEREAYRGGIVECFKLKKLQKQQYYLLDINSMYVSVMSKHKLPTYPVMYRDNPELSDLENSIQNGYYIIADVLLCVEYNYGKYALKHDNKLIFPNGEFRIQLHLPEILEALKKKIITKVFCYVIYNQEYCLDEYADYFSEMKKNATNKIDYDLYKLLGNGLYGRLALQKYINTEAEPETYIGSEHKPYIMSNRGVYIKWRDKFIRTYTDGLQHVPRTNVALSGAVTAYSRILLSSYIERAGIEHIYYSDTDSLMVDEIGYSRLKSVIDDKELGKLKCELLFNTGTINAPKNYCFALKQKLMNCAIKGEKAKCGLVKTENTLNSFMYSNILTLEQKSIIIKRRTRSKGIPTGAVNHDGQYIFMRFTTFKENLKSGGKLKGRHLHKRKNSLKYTKGITIEKLGNITQPFTMEYVYNKEHEKWENAVIEHNPKTIPLKQKKLKKVN